MKKPSIADNINKKTEMIPALPTIIINGI